MLAEREAELHAAHDELERIQAEISSKLQEVERRAESLAQHEIRLLKRERGTLSRSAAALNAISLVGRPPAFANEAAAATASASAADVEVLLKQIDALNERGESLKTENARLRDEVSKVRATLAAEIEVAQQALEREPTQVGMKRPGKTTLFLLARELRRDPLHIVTAVLVAVLASGLGYLAGGRSERPRAEAQPAPAVVEKLEAPAKVAPVVAAPPSVPLEPVALTASPAQNVEKRSSGTRGGHSGARREGTTSRKGRKGASLSDIFSDDSDAEPLGAGKTSKRLTEVSTEARTRGRDLAGCLGSAGSGTHQVGVGFSVSAAGQASGAKARRTGVVSSADVASCVERVVSAWRFPPGEAVSVATMTIGVRVQ